MRRIACTVTIVLAVFILFTGMIAACGGGGGGGGGGPVTYNGSTDPAVADSTNAAALAEYAMGGLEAGFPVVESFGNAPFLLAANNLGAGFTTTVVIQTPPGAEMYAPGLGSGALDGTVTLFLFNDVSPMATIWEVDGAVFDGTVVFNGYEVEKGGLQLDGTAQITDGFFYFSGLALFDMDLMEITNDPGWPIWQELYMTATRITVSEFDDSWSIGELDWYLAFDRGVATVEITSMTVGYEGKTYKIEDTLVTVTEGIMTAPPAATPQVMPTTKIFEISGFDSIGNGTFYHYDYGVIYFAGTLFEDTPPGTITSGGLTFQDAIEEDLFFLDFVYDFFFGETAYQIYVVAEDYFQWGYFIDGSFVEDPSAASNFMI